MPHSAEKQVENVIRENNSSKFGLNDKLLRKIMYSPLLKANARISNYIRQHIYMESADTDFKSLTFDKKEA